MTWHTLFRDSVLCSAGEESPLGPRPNPTGTGYSVLNTPVVTIFVTDVTLTHAHPSHGEGGLLLPLHQRHLSIFTLYHLLLTGGTDYVC